MKSILLCLVGFIASVLFYFHLESKGRNGELAEDYTNMVLDTKAKLEVVSSDGQVILDAEDRIQKYDVDMGIAFPTSIELQDNWQAEYGCEFGCEYDGVKAVSLDDALWLKRRGYLSESMFEAGDSISKQTLTKNAYKGDVVAAKLLVHQHIKNENPKLAKRLSHIAMAHSDPRDTSNYVMHARSLLLNDEVMLASIELKKAMLLGDNTALGLYEELTNSSSAAFIDTINNLALNYVGSMLPGEGFKNWNNDPRPGDE